MKVQVIEDSNGEPTGVFIPMNKWQELKKLHKDLEVLEYHEPSKTELILELKQAIKELSLIEKGEMKSRPAKEFLDEL